MTQEMFELVASGLRYWIAALVVYILVRCALAVRKSFAVEKRERKRHEGGYALGVLEIVDPGENPNLQGMRFVLRQENRMGSDKSCDIYIPERSVRPVQATIYQKGRDVFISDQGTRAGVGLNGYRLQENVPLMDGDEIQLSGVLLRLNLKPTFRGAQRADMKPGDRERQYLAEAEDEDDESWDEDDEDEHWDSGDWDENSER